MKIAYKTYAECSWLVGTGSPDHWPYISFEVDDADDMFDNIIAYDGGRWTIATDEEYLIYRDAEYIEYTDYFTTQSAQKYRLFNDYTGNFVINFDELCAEIFPHGKLLKKCEYDEFGQLRQIYYYTDYIRAYGSFEPAIDSNGDIVYDDNTLYAVITIDYHINALTNVISSKITVVHWILENGTIGNAIGFIEPVSLNDAILMNEERRKNLWTSIKTGCAIVYWNNTLPITDLRLALEDAISDGKLTDFYNGIITPLITWNLSYVNSNWDTEITTGYTLRDFVNTKLQGGAY